MSASKSKPSSSTVIIGLSGGVDSAVAALRLLEKGRNVQAMFMKNWDEDDGTEYCTAIQDLEDAQRVADKLGIVLHTANFAAEYWDNVFQTFLTEYRAGRTPNPDVLCNREIKFKVFIDYAKALGGAKIATGHYAQIIAGTAGPELHKGIDDGKDQSYFLQAVPLEQLAQCEFPLGAMHKSDVRALAKRAGLHNHARKDSTGICFIGERRFADFLARYIARDPGPIVDSNGGQIGEHSGLSYYTLGQRQGLGIGGRSGAAEAPWYVIGKDLGTNTLIVSQTPRDLEGTWLTAQDMNWLGVRPDCPTAWSAKIRYRQPDQPCSVQPSTDGSITVQFEHPQRAITPGQYVGFYDGTRCLGGGVIQTTGPRGPAPAT